MEFKPSIERIRDIVERRLTKVDVETKNAFPSVLKLPSVHWVSLGNDALLSLLFITDDDLGRIKSYQTQNFEPFPGLFTTDSTLPAAFGFSKSRFGVVRGCSVTNSISFSVGKDTTFIVLDHTQSIETKELGVINYKLPLGYFVSFGDEITPDNAYENLEELIVYSIKVWRESHDK
ncbi:MAG: hypothetical protein MUO85_06065 [candidate division Zixibacteria bacterium]|nr:hypothetical protein [candidate division Zixibacteria bacterium]